MIKKRKTQISVSYIKRTLKFENYKNYLEATPLESKINYLEKYEINVNSLNEHHKEFIRNNKFILETQQRFKTERHNVLLKK